MSVRKVVGKAVKERKLHLRIKINIVFGEESPFVDAVWNAAYPELQHIDLDKWEKRCCRESSESFPWIRELAGIVKISQQTSAEKDNINKLRQKAFEEAVKPKLLELQEKIKENQLLGISGNWGEHVYLYKDAIYKFDRDYSDEEMLLQILDFEDKERRKFERLKRKLDLTQQVDKAPKRETIPEEVRIAVWRRDEGKCSRCGNRKNLEYDHIIPISKGGSNTVRNIELLCEECNRRKKDNIE